MTSNPTKPSTARRLARKTMRSSHERPRNVHDEIKRQSVATIAGRRHWHPEEYPALWKLLQAAKAEARARRRLKGRIVFSYEGRRYAARFSNLDRVIVEDRSTGEFIASSGIFAL